MEGAARLRRTLRQAGADLKDFSTLNKQVANVVVAQAKTTAPYGPDVNGHIRNTIRGGGGRTAAVVRVGNKRQPYGPGLHWGWKRRQQAEQPWVSEAAQTTEPAWREIYFAGLTRIINQIEGA